MSLWYGMVVCVCVCVAVVCRFKVVESWERTAYDGIGFFKLGRLRLARARDYGSILGGQAGEPIARQHTQNYGRSVRIGRLWKPETLTVLCRLIPGTSIIGL